jgi:nitrite reductase/ring-hydroxylating ferredoxin subunit
VTGDPPIRWIDVCAAEDLVERGDGVRLALAEGHDAATAFVIRFDGKPRAYRNRCANRSIELDWLPGRFFDDAGLYLICAMHGATYRADTGLCVAGPCVGAVLEPLQCEEREGRIRVACPLPEHEPGKTE